LINYVQPGNVLELTAPSGGVVSGAAVQIGQMVGIATTSAAQAAKFNLAVTGVFTVVKATGETWGEGELVYFDGTEFTTTGTSNLLVGVAVAAAGSADTSGVLRLNGIAQADEAGE
jgi:predicted RecA/RadA family phage recombinase